MKEVFFYSKFYWMQMFERAKYAGNGIEIQFPGKGAFQSQTLFARHSARTKTWVHWHWVN